MKLLTIISLLSFLLLISCNQDSDLDNKVLEDRQASIQKIERLSGDLFGTLDHYSRNSTGKFEDLLSFWNNEVVQPNGSYNGVMLKIFYTKLTHPDRDFLSQMSQEEINKFGNILIIYEPSEEKSAFRMLAYLQEHNLWSEDKIQQSIDLVIQNASEKASGFRMESQSYRKTMETINQLQKLKK